ncbi:MULTISPECIES: YdeI/OmpD-associated family protein [Robiginitalea]|uniref:Bacteriocin-protection protein, YdeI/OmpD-associated family n=1 Tax=Robiginitalea biformata (strain ATCC BAA-864 / DSM 15991 / KCTC 12146 / HTCC2501) TaxID=313596 RepID=A4CNN9_ROBBH|nr:MULTISPECIES: YdeI/OmpD-associated family protein [Robiginitalea]EAR14506.1 hypothetical protein RB2501_00481 [Robiginitalea biformata HTCC2501]MDC6355009.1 YdeI/OmpD-associated family protein [Robiginitalea sp. PM2]MDC6375276.1 YdeI/OmpD-associated family protein [Robiginitalea sp. SP8]
MDLETHYFPTAGEWRRWLDANAGKSRGIYLIFYTVAHEKTSMRWEEAVREALCFGWIDSTVKSLGSGKRRQYFCPRKPGSVWSKVNKQHVRELMQEGRMRPGGLAVIEAAKKDGSWSALDDVENGVVPADLREAFELHPEAREFFEEIARTYRKSYLYWLFQAKREATRNRRIKEIIRLLKAGKKTRSE